MDQHQMSDVPGGDAVDPVCGMTVDSKAQTEKGLHSNYNGTDYYFCSRGCKLDFDENPANYID